jgi:hypothetical protein
MERAPYVQKVLIGRCVANAALVCAQIRNVANALHGVPFGPGVGMKRGSARGPFEEAVDRQATHVVANAAKGSKE